MLRGLVGTQGCECTSGCSSDAWLGLLVVCPSAEVLVVCACILRCTGVCYAQACACTRVSPPQKVYVVQMCVRKHASPSAKSVLCTCVCAHTCPSLQKVYAVHTCVHTHASPSAKGVCRAYVCVHTHPTLQGVYVMYTCVHAHTCILFTAFHAHMCTHTCVTSAEGVFCARVHIRTPLCRTPVLTRGVQVSAHTCAPGSPHLLYTRGAGWGSHSPPSFAGQVLSPCSSPLPCCPPEPDIYILIFSKGGNALRCKCLHCGCT